MTYLVYCDGACEDKNPGGWGVGGWVLKDENGNRVADGTADLGQSPEMTNNQAEYVAVRSALEHLVDNNLNKETIVIHSDSKLVINQINDEWACRSSKLIPFRDSIWLLLEKFPRKVIFRWIPREMNTEADAMSRSLYPWTKLDSHVWFDENRIRLWKKMKDENEK